MPAGQAYGFDFGVRAGVERRPGTLDAFSQNLAGADDQRAHRGIAGARRDLRQFQAPPHVHRRAHVPMVARPDGIEVDTAPAARPRGGLEAVRCPRRTMPSSNTPCVDMVAHAPEA
ncbi:hypothetical protein D3C83_30610 [compost metagenome]